VGRSGIYTGNLLQTAKGTVRCCPIQGRCAPAWYPQLGLPEFDVGADADQAAEAGLARFPSGAKAGQRIRVSRDGHPERVARFLKVLSVGILLHNPVDRRFSPDF
jgi:hypothetical protein